MRRYCALQREKLRNTASSMCRRREERGGWGEQLREEEEEEGASLFLSHRAEQTGPPSTFVDEDIRADKVETLRAFLAARTSQRLARHGPLTHRHDTSSGTRFTCFTGTKVQILTPEELLLLHACVRQRRVCAIGCQWRGGWLCGGHIRKKRKKKGEITRLE